METAEAVSDNEEQAIRADRVLAIGQEVRVQAEGDCSLGAGEEVGLEDRVVERDEALEDLGVVLVEDVLLDVRTKLVRAKDLGGLQASVRESRAASRKR
jgi:hypothetical protein